MFDYTIYLNKLERGFVEYLKDPAKYRFINHSFEMIILDFYFFHFSMCFSEQEIETRMMTIQALKLVKLCRNEYDSSADIFVSDDNVKCPHEFMESMRYVAKYITDQRRFTSFDQTNYVK